MCKTCVRLFFHYACFDIAKWSYLLFGAVVAYVALGPSVVSGEPDRLEPWPA